VIEAKNEHNELENEEGQGDEADHPDLGRKRADSISKF